MTTISVIIPTWNRSRSLERAVRSALAQTHAPLEVLVCDDGSTDDTQEVVRCIGDSRVVWLPGERGGRPAIPRNRGIRASRGEWLAFLDDDDVWLPEKLACQLEHLRTTGCFACCSDAFRVVPEEGNRGPLLGLRADTVRFAEMMAVNRVICSSVVASSVLVKGAGGFPESASLKAIEDYALWLKLLTMTDFAFVATPLLEYHDDPRQSVRKGGSYDLQQQAVVEEFCRWAQQRGSRYLAEAAALKRSRAVTTWPLGRLACYLRRAFAKP